MVAYLTVMSFANKMLIFVVLFLPSVVSSSAHDEAISVCEANICQVSWVAQKAFVFGLKQITSMSSVMFSHMEIKMRISSEILIYPRRHPAMTILLHPCFVKITVKNFLKWSVNISNYSNSNYLYYLQRNSVFQRWNIMAVVILAELSNVEEISWIQP